MIEVAASDEEVIRQHQEAKKLAELVARVERERTSTGDSVRKAMRRMDEFSLVCSELIFTLAPSLPVSSCHGCHDHSAIPVSGVEDIGICQIAEPCHILPDTCCT